MSDQKAIRTPKEEQIEIKNSGTHREILLILNDPDCSCSCLKELLDLIRNRECAWSCSYI